MNPEIVTSEEPVEIALLALIGKGDVTAFSELYDRLAGVLMGLATQILRDTTAAEDVLQEVFVQIWERAASYDPKLGKPLTWAITLTRNRAIDRLRATQRAQRLIEAATQEHAAIEEPVAGADHAAVSQETARQVRAALTALSADQRQAIEMAFFNGLTQTEIATTLAVPLGTVKARIRRGMLELRETLDACLGAAVLN